MSELNTDGIQASGVPSCVFNEGVECKNYNRPCHRCGWNPVVAYARLKAFCQEHGIAVPQAYRNRENIHTTRSKL